MDSCKETQPKGEFKCELCGLTAPYTCYGQKPPNTCSIEPKHCRRHVPHMEACTMAKSLHRLLEESYMMKDPFTPDKDSFLILGSQCSLCSRLVCVGTECSLFYSKRFCLPCVNENLKAFPLEIQEDMDKRKPPPKSSPSKKMDAKT